MRWHRWSRSWCVVLATLASSVIVAPPSLAAKRAVIVGVDAYPAVKPLAGCVLDSSRMTVVTSKGFGFEDVTVLANEKASRANILDALEETGDRSRRGDLVVFFYSGHGTLFPDDRSEERDETVALPANPALHYAEGRYDSAICPVDAGGPSTSGKPWKNLILDDELFRVFSSIARRGALVFVISDSCHSGTLARDLGTGELPKYLPLREIIPKLDAAPPPSVSRAPRPDRGLSGLYLGLTSSKDNQASIATPQGSFFTRAFVDALVASHGDVTWLDLFERIHSAVLRMSGGRQEPQLDTRFFRGDLDFPVFSVPEGAETAPDAGGSAGGLRLVVRVRDESGRPLPESLFCVVKPGRRPPPGAITSDDTLVMGKTDARGLKDAGRVAGLRDGSYWVKVVREGYRTFWDSVEVREQTIRGTAVLSFGLAPAP